MQELVDIISESRAISEVARAQSVQPEMYVCGDNVAHLSELSNAQAPMAPPALPLARAAKAGGAVGSVAAPVAPDGPGVAVSSTDDSKDLQTAVADMQLELADDPSGRKRITKTMTKTGIDFSP